MIVYGVFVFWLMGIYVVLKKNYKSKSGKMLFCSLATICFVILSGLRKITVVGADTLTYKNEKWDKVFLKDWNMLFSDIVPFIRSGYFYNNGYYNVEEPLYDIFQKICQIFFQNYQIYLIIVALIVTVPLSVIIYKYSANVLVSYLVYFSLFWNFWGITGICQTIAMVITAFYGNKLLREKKYVKYIFLVLGASLIHKSAFIALCLLPFARRKITVMNNLVYILGAIFCFCTGDIIIAMISGRYGKEKFAGYIFWTVYFVVMAIFCWIYKKARKDMIYRVVYNACFLGLMIVPMGRWGIRAAQYFSIWLILLVPEILENILIVKNEKLAVKSIAIFAMLFLFFKNYPIYQFCWQ